MKGYQIRKTSSDKDFQVYHAVSLDKIADYKSVEYIDSVEYLDDGEVSWEIPIRIFPSDEKTKTDLTKIETVDKREVEYKLNANYFIFSGIIKSLNKEIFRIDTFYDIVSSIYANKNNSYFSNVLFVIFVSALRYGNRFINQQEIYILKDAYNQPVTLSYVEDSLKVRKYASSIFLVILFILTKNIQIAE
jgi:hypothetical protein